MHIVNDFGHVASVNQIQMFILFNKEIESRPFFKTY